MDLYVAITTGVFSLCGIGLTAALRSLRHENAEQHGQSLEMLARVDERSKITLQRVTGVADRLDDHLEHHLELESRLIQ